MVYLGADHGGFHLKEKIKEWLTAWGYEWEDLGNQALDANDDYPLFASAVAKKVTEEERVLKGYVPLPERSRGILACRSAAGMVIAANKVKGVRAVAVFNQESAKHSREHNDANVLGLSGDWLTDDQAKDIVKTWLETEYTHEERHERRIQKIIAEEQR